ncbi:MAG TPA: sigma-70 family RNA polymerase sigma factor [Candidatus Scatomorpha merdipullorum]|uniref:Sigma-70 family RNA polymerase sigma factor n=1 Tax=Candidatus Scatomorpha merdipullorum TaxID=2840927 RepID=A0A9D1FD53_9FIRM|nr:sigma-70 family RNA polymerase sigma factor [Candidatus Scatomorpha merdipullorum]
MKEFDLEEAMRLYSGRLFAYALALLCDRHEAEDAVQDAFVSAYVKRSRFKGEGELTWLYAILRNKCRDRLRRRKHLPLEQLGEAEAVDFDGEGRVALTDALRQLSAEERELVLSRAVEGLDYAAIARRMRISEAAARKRYERAKRRLAALLGDNS